MIETGYGRNCLPVMRMGQDLKAYGRLVDDGASGRILSMIKCIIRFQERSCFSGVDTVRTFAVAGVLLVLQSTLLLK